MPRQTRHRTNYNGVYFVELANQVQSFFIRYKRNGKSIEEKAGRSNHGWNAEKSDQLRTERISGISTVDGDMQYEKQFKDQQLWTFSKIFAEYLRIRRELKGRENDVYRFKNYLEMEFADKTPEDVTHEDVESIRHNLQNKRLKPATVRHALELLRRLANFAAKKKLCSGLSFKIEMPRVENHKTESLTQVQLQKLLDVLDEEQDVQVSNLVRLALFTGMRRGELFSLRWSDIDFYNKTITVRSGKNEQYPRIPLNELAGNVLTDQAQLGNGSKFVFPGRGGKKRTECKRPLLRIRLKAGLPDDFRILQGLRHVYASMLISSGNVELETLQSLLTHKSPLMTQRYAHLLDDVRNKTDSMADEDSNSVFDSAEKKETISDTMNSVLLENAQQPAFPQENVSEPLVEEDTLEEEKVEDYAAECAGTVIRLKAESLREEHEEDFAEDYAVTGIPPAAEPLEEEQEDDFVGNYVGREETLEAEETSHAEDNLSTDSTEKAQKNKDLDLYLDTEFLKEKTFSSDNVFTEFFEKNKNLTNSDKYESTEPAESTEEAAKAIEYEEAIVTSEDEEMVDLSEHAPTEPNVERCFEYNTLEYASLWRTERVVEGTVHSENESAGAAEVALGVEENSEIEFVLRPEKGNTVRANYYAEQHYEAQEEDSLEENVASEYEEDAQNQGFISKISKPEPKLDKKDVILNQILKQDLSEVASKEAHVNEVLKAKKSAAEDIVQQKSRPSIEELKKDLRLLSQLIYSAPRRVKTSATRSSQN